MTKRDHLAGLTAEREKVLLALREREPELMEDLRAIDAMIAGFKAEFKEVRDDDDYSRFRLPSDALLHYLDKVGKPQTQEEIRKAIAARGFTSSKKVEAQWSVDSAIRHQIKIKNLVRRNGLIGKPGWPEDLFKSEET